MIIKVYNSNVLFETYEFNESSKKWDEDMRYPPLINSMTNDSYLNKYTGFVYYTFILTKTELLNMSKLYAYQEGDYELRWMDGDNSYKCYLVSDFSQKKVGYKDDLSQYEFPLTLEIVKAVDLNTNLYYYSDHFLIDALTNQIFIDKYSPKWVDSTGMATTENSYLILPRLVSHIYQDISAYSKANADFIFNTIKTTFWNSDSVYILTALWFGQFDYIYILYWPKIKYMEAQFRENGTLHVFDIVLDDRIDYDCKIKKEGDQYYAYYKEAGASDWIEIGSHSFTNSPALNQVRIGDNAVAFALDEFKLTPDELRQ